MDEKTEELRDIFMDVSDEETVTESQEDTRGSLVGDDEGVDDSIADVVDRLRERFGFATDLPTADLVMVVRRFYEGDDDEAIAAALDVSRDAVVRARLDLHLFRDADTDAPFDLDALADPSEDSVDAVAADLDADPEAVRHYRRVVAAREEARRVSHRFRSEYEDALAEAGLSTTMTDAMREDGLQEATEDIDSLEEDADVSF